MPRLVPSEKELTERVSRCARKILEDGKSYAMFDLERVHDGYRSVKNEEFDALLSDDGFHERGHTDVTGGPLNEKYDPASWARELVRTIETKYPDHVIFYLRRDAHHVAARVVISVQDFYGGLTHEEAAKRYGDLFPRMERHLDGITLSVSADGKVRIPFSDLRYASAKAKGEPVSPEAWD